MNGEIVRANNFGSYYSTNLVKGNTRKYHALMVNSTSEFERKVIVSSTREVIAVSALGEFDFSANYFGDNTQPGLVKHLRNSYYLPYPTQIFRFGPVTVKKQVEVSETENIVKLIYTVESPEAYRLIIEPLLTYRNYHSLNSDIDFGHVSLEQQEKVQRLKITEDLGLIMKSNMNFEPGNAVSKNHYYPVESERGYPAYEDLHSIGVYTVSGDYGKQEFTLSFAVNHKPEVRKFFRSIVSANHSENRSILTDISRFNEIYSDYPGELNEYLVWNARQFIVKSEKRYSLLAGYHWFGEWSRDTFISFKGILLGLGRYHEAQRVLLDWSKYISVGLLPNTMEGIHYNSLDGILWYFQALWYYWEVTKDAETVAHILPKLERVVYAFSRGSKYGIQIDPKGYLIWTDNSKALTWMDAVVDNKPIIPRAGAAIEIQALWYNALQILEKLSMLTNYKLINIGILDELEKLLENNFEKDFWLEEYGFYADRIENNGSISAELRPNQLAAFALTFRLGHLEHAHKAMKTIEKRLLTKVGLRTLAPDMENYLAEYAGSQPERDKAYHQGAVWPWLLMLYYAGKLKINNYSSSSVDDVKNHILDFWSEIKLRKLIHIPELFAAVDLHENGAVSQCWSVAAIIEGIMLTKDN